MTFTDFHKHNISVVFIARLQGDVSISSVRILLRSCIVCKPVTVICLNRFDVSRTNQISFPPNYFFILFEILSVSLVCFSA